MTICHISPTPSTKSLKNYELHEAMMEELVKNFQGFLWFLVQCLVIFWCHVHFVSHQTRPLLLIAPYIVMLSNRTISGCTFICTCTYIRFNNVICISLAVAQSDEVPLFLSMSCYSLFSKNAIKLISSNFLWIHQIFAFVFPKRNTFYACKRRSW